MADFQGKYNGEQIEQLLDKANDIDLSKYALKTDNAPTATKLQAARTIALSGAVTGSVSSDFGSNITISTTLANFDASKITSGTIDIDRLPKAALERMVVVADDTARFKLTTATAQVGDTVKVTATNKMYLVKDDSKLNTEAGYEPYTASSASSVPWSGVTGKPSTFAPPTAAASTLGGVKVGYTTSGKNYKLQVDASGNAFVNVPWTDNNTTYNQATAKEIIEARLDESRILNEEKSAKYEELRSYEAENLHEFFLDDQDIYIPEYDRRSALADGAIVGKITIMGLEFDMTEGKILIGMMDKYDNDLTTALGDKQKQISIATTVEQVRAVDVQSGYPDKVSVTTAYIQQQAKEKDALDPQKVAVEFSRMLVNDKSLSLSSNEKLDVKVLFPIWGQEGAEFGLSVDTGFCLRVVKEDTDILYEVIQPHTLSSEWEPGLSTASLYKVVDKEHVGTIGDPIPYFPPMEIFKDKYYIQNADVYKCTRDSGTPLSHNLKDLVGLYVEVVQG